MVMLNSPQVRTPQSVSTIRYLRWETRSLITEGPKSLNFPLGRFQDFKNFPPCRFQLLRTFQITWNLPQCLSVKKPVCGFWYSHIKTLWCTKAPQITKSPHVSLSCCSKTENRSLISDSPSCALFFNSGSDVHHQKRRKQREGLALVLVSRGGVDERLGQRWHGWKGHQ